MPIPILCYHSVSAVPSPEIAPFAVHPDELARQLDLATEGGYTALTVSELVDALDQQGSVPPRTVVVTFDDGYGDNLTIAGPLLASRGLRATLYVTTGYLPGCPAGNTPEAPPQMIPWDHLSSLEAAGFEVGAHSHTHPQLDVLSRAAASTEIRQSKALLEDALGHAVRSFAYPHGYASPWVRSEVRRRGFDSACGVRNALSHNEDDRWLLARLTVMATTPLSQVQSWLDGSGASVAGPRRQARTRAWRGYRQARAIASRSSLR